MKLTLEQVEHVANLARLGLTEEEKERFAEQLSAILEYAEMLQGLDTEAILPTAMVVPLQNVLRPDVVTPSLEREDALANAPRRDGEFFRVPAILE
jgi:aspartyl-tRNA(Asn)/glutamyl-tRNA(Gln) amidotransferase subunit C